MNCKSDVACRTQGGQESPKERASPEVLLYSEGNSLSRGHKKDTQGFRDGNTRSVREVPAT